ncbi:Uncharacterised protein [Aeromonas salmonicida]|nr:Uncharacterised protein [Aeromonas salmonicida]
MGFVVGKITISIFLGILLYGFYHALNGNFYLAISMALLAIAILFLASNDYDIFDESFSFLLTLSTVFAVIQLFNDTNILDMRMINKQNSLMMQSLEAGFCPSINQPNEYKRMTFEQLKNTLFKSCATQNHRDMMALTVDLSKTVYLDPVTGTIDSLYNDFIKKKDMTPTCLDIAQEMDRLCPGFLEL